MSVMNFQPSFKDVKPPEKGSFPLDHEGKHQCNTFSVTNAKVKNKICHQYTVDNKPDNTIDTVAYFGVRPYE